MLIALTDLEGATLPSTSFKIGTVVQHKLYGYRGVIVAYDPHCMAGDTWYYANKTQPVKEQAWYHMLVHDSGGLSTYVAQSNLEADESAEPVNHPRLGSYFCEFKDGAYQVHPEASGSCGI